MMGPTVDPQFGTVNGDLGTIQKYLVNKQTIFQAIVHLATNGISVREKH